MEEYEGLGPAQDALNRMKIAFDRRTGCRLTAEMIASLSCTIIGQAWNEADPRQRQLTTPKIAEDGHG